MMDPRHAIYYEKQGDGPPAILIHGMGASLRQWDYLMPQLAAAGFSAYALDLPGHGDSLKPEAAEHYQAAVAAAPEYAPALTGMAYLAERTARHDEAR